MIKGIILAREMEILRKNQMEMLEMKNSVTETKNAFDEFVSRLDAAEELKNLKVNKWKLHNLKHKEKKE